MSDPLARALVSLKDRFADHEAFARLVIDKLDDTYMVENDAKENVTVQWWDPLRRVWVRAGGGRRLQMKVVDICRRDARPLDNRGERGAAPSLYGNKHFFAPVCDIVKSYLPTAQEVPKLDGDVTRGLFRFSCGRVLELGTGRVRWAAPADRISKSCGYPYKPWAASPAVQAEVKALVTDICKHWESGATSVDTIFLVPRLEGLKKTSRYLSRALRRLGCHTVAHVPSGQVSGGLASLRGVLLALGCHRQQRQRDPDQLAHFAAQRQGERLLRPARL
jgi:hypothetical protein